MLTHLFIENFTIIDKLDLAWHSCMTVITGETGAGKSILLDALELVLGARADNAVVRPHSDRCEIIATFDIAKNKQAREWLVAHDLLSDEECLLRRSISQEGRSKCFINGQPVTQQLLRELGSLLINIHGQHEHQQLLQRESQRELLDAFAGHASLCTSVRNTYKQWRDIKDQLEQQQQLLGDRDSRLAFLKYQVIEFEQLNFTTDELMQLDNEHKKLAGAEQRIEKYQQLLQLLDNDNVTQAHVLANSLPEKNIAELLDNAVIQIKEAVSELENCLECSEINPGRLQQLEQRLAKIHDLARKHRIKIEELPILQEKINAELHSLEKLDVQLTELQKALVAATSAYEKVAEELSKSREKAAKKMAKAIEHHMQTLGMPGGKMAIQLEPQPATQFSAHGREKVEFLVSANPGLPLQSLTKVASGGELSRISLAIQVIAAQQQPLPTLIFDEVDVGIGGGTASIVGQLLKKLANHAQIICVTHLPQVAAHGQQHLHVHKSISKNQTSTTINYLTADEKIQEIARMLGGLKITTQTLAHAREMLNETA
jgi:DNA repair protein RecN (Recombination protein N)